MILQSAVVPGYYLVCYNVDDGSDDVMEAVVPGYYLVCYNENAHSFSAPQL